MFLCSLLCAQNTTHNPPLLHLPIILHYTTSPHVTNNPSLPHCHPSSAYVTHVTKHHRTSLFLMAPHPSLVCVCLFCHLHGDSCHNGVFLQTGLGRNSPLHQCHRWGTQIHQYHRWGTQIHIREL